MAVARQEVRQRHHEQPQRGDRLHQSEPSIVTSYPPITAHHPDGAPQRPLLHLQRERQEEEEAPSGVGGRADHAQAQHGGGGQRQQQDLHEARDWR